jgi:hypothetical protein
MSLATRVTSFMSRFMLAQLVARSIEPLLAMFKFVRRNEADTWLAAAVRLDTLSRLEAFFLF